MLPDSFQPQYRLLSQPLPDALTLSFAGDALLLGEGRLASLALLPPPETLLWIGDYQGRPVQVAGWRGLDALPAGIAAHALRGSYGLLDEAAWLMAGRASQLLTFHRTHAYCGVCGGATQPVPDEASRRCPACGHQVWPRVSPAMMVLIRRGRDLLLARSPHFRSGVYSALAGFVEPGESLEACAHRETMEEVGVRIANLRWFGSQSWAFPHSLMLAFEADYVSGDIVPEAGEIEDARWFSPERLPELPSPGSIAYRLIRAALER
ncbi:NAD(+) diphosphatase [Chitiniphilus eburneus]|uniref:NAD(+) diphosphatase n=1 Tax=Chitiniphilus eburneus TaxID=2571148 RepID=A0A4U0PZB2_9NEIS|nr:NAD(+) diphosphatase [Chitiniphilus eburneus]TJZ73012.1 NAD(+) diphosphatase [Chitiniphilus eburneus]